MAGHGDFRTGGTPRSPPRPHAGKIGSASPAFPEVDAFPSADRDFAATITPSIASATDDTAASESVGRRFFVNPMAVPGWSPTGRFTTIFPLGIFVFVSMMKEAYDDYFRHRHDASENNALVRRLKREPNRRTSHKPRTPDIELVQSGGGVALEWENIGCKDIQVGDIVCVKDRESLPADLVLLRSTNPNGVAFIETSNLDGETNLKQRQALKITNESIDSVYRLGKYHALVHACPPSGDLYNFDGYLAEGKGRFPLTPNQLLLRGSILRNTREAYGVAVYTGEECKIRMNSSPAASRKAPHLEHLTNKIVIIVFCCQLLLAGALTGLSFWWSHGQNGNGQHWYLERSSSSAGDTVTTFANFVVLFNAFIPISLYVSMEILKVFQVYLMASDIAMYDEETDTAMAAHTSALNEELGQVQFVFSDKTGTLTENRMEFKMFSVAGRNVRHYSVPESACPGSLSAEEVILELVEARQRGHRLNPQLQHTFDFLEAMALCHTVVPEHVPLKDEKSKSVIRASLLVRPEETAITFQSSSADEVALLTGARDMFFTLKGRTPDHVFLNIMNSSQDIAYQLMETIEFTSDRKRMSVIYRYPNGRIILLCKGADNVVLERLSNPNPRPNDPGYATFQSTLKDMDDYATQGLRTLLYAYRVLDPEEYRVWSARYAEASAVVQNRAAQIAAVAEEIERGMMLLGVTAIEDRLQSEVPETIEKLRRANIRVWMLTGDKKETAINIGRTCNLIKKNSTILRVGDSRESQSKSRGDVEDPVAKSVAVAVRTFLDRQRHRNEGGEPEGADNEQQRETFVLVVDGPTMTHLQQLDTGAPHSVMEEFLSLAVCVDNVICCRFSPSQKALIVTMVRQRLARPLRPGQAGLSELEQFIVARQPPTWRRLLDRMLLRPGESGVTLAIGDGANDIPMIESAHVGIGISGREGLAASRAADYSIAKFKFLQPLLFVHGHWSYIRNSLFTLAIFYKNIAFYGCQAIFQVFAAASGTSLFEQWALAANNVAFTSLPVIVVGIFEKDLNRTTLMAVPELYRFGQLNLGFNFRIFFRWILQGAVHAALAVLLPAVYYLGFWTRGADVTERLVELSGGQMAVDPSRQAWLRELFAESGDGGTAQAASLYALGTAAYAISVVFCTFKVLYVEARTITWAHHAAAAVSVVAFAGFTAVYPLTWPHFGIDTGYEFVGIGRGALLPALPATLATALLAAVLGLFVFDGSLRFLSRSHRLNRHGPRGGRTPPAETLVESEAPLPPMLLPAEPAPREWPPVASREAAAAAEEAEVAAAHALGPHDWAKDGEWWQVWERVHGVRSST
ncbi:hypothetical protein HK405_001855 [Cladochytrium tenue]|nr:hypothetical protein HK405_001855 [Cladochytrium tenue]